MEFTCLCCNANFKTSSNLRKHERTAKHLKVKAKLDAEPTENIQLRNTISELEKENSTLKKHIAELEKENKNKQQTINTIVQVVNKLAKVEPEVEVKEIHEPEPEVEVKIHEPEPEVEVKEIHEPEAEKEPEAEEEPEPEHEEEEEDEPEHEEEEETRIIKHSYTPGPVPKSKEKKKEYYYANYINLRPEDLDFIVDNNMAESDIYDIDRIRSDLDDVRRERKYTREKIIDMFKQVFNDRSPETPIVNRWKTAMEAYSLERIQSFLSQCSEFEYASERIKCHLNP